jgi:Mn-dependent DtxR family transcriptional regulator
MTGLSEADLRAILEVALPEASNGAIKSLMYLCRNDGVTVARLSKDLNLGESAVRRAMIELGEEKGAGLIRVAGDGRIHLTELGQKIAAD